MNEWRVYPVSATDAIFTAVVGRSTDGSVDLCPLTTWQNDSCLNRGQDLGGKQVRLQQVY